MIVQQPHALVTRRIKNPGSARSALKSTTTLPPDTVILLIVGNIIAGASGYAKISPTNGSSRPHPPDGNVSTTLASSVIKNRAGKSGAVAAYGAMSCGGQHEEPPALQMTLQ